MSRCRHPVTMRMRLGPTLTERQAGKYRGWQVLCEACTNCGFVTKVLQDLRPDQQAWIDARNARLAGRKHG